MKNTVLKSLAVGIAALGIALLGAASASAQATLEAVKKRDKLLCGIPMPSAGFGAPDSKGVVQGFDADICRALSSAIFGDPGKVDFVHLNPNVRFEAVQSGEVDLLSRYATVTFSRDASLGLDFSPILFYDGQGLMVSAKLGVKSAMELKGASVCVLPGTTTIQNLTDYFRAKNIKFEAVVVENGDEWRRAFFAGRCDAITSDLSDLASVRAVANNPADFVVLPETISKEPTAATVRQGDANWRDIVTWVSYGLIAAEEAGINQANVDTFLTSEDPEIQRMLGVTGDLGKMLGLDNKWLYNAIKQVGNYEDIFDRTIGPKTPLGLSRGENQLWTKGGLLYAPPFR
ncbi:general L-amino acid transport system substrate-binding protein [Mesorhizobium soli]|uniref:amino acid ABC transporter substrate-binding protein n=1 Tax=Pseudaminobacter soli (ex Li et al. 2025) TaxID=1295366 RepID=UPI002472F653|nr:amino acid ABC transporter substrate-binding protein [Mesorhizobium soli]MDH6232220.1 general L-amino acid transport system substrate-binding protein [Mesorhizobium soli]